MLVLPVQVNSKNQGLRLKLPQMIIDYAEGNGITQQSEGVGVMLYVIQKVVSLSMPRVQVWCHRACQRCRCDVKEHVIGAGVESQSMLGYSCGVTEHVKGADVVSPSMLGCRCGVTERVRVQVVSQSMLRYRCGVKEHVGVQVWCHRACQRCRCGVTKHVGVQVWCHKPC